MQSMPLSFPRRHGRLAATLTRNPAKPRHAKQHPRICGVLVSSRAASGCYPPSLSSLVPPGGRGRCIWDGPGTFVEAGEGDRSLCSRTKEIGIEAGADPGRLVEIVVENASRVITVRPEVIGQVDVFIPLDRVTIIAGEEKVRPIKLKRGRWVFGRTCSTAIEP